MPTRMRALALTLALVGLGFATEAAWVHYHLLTDPAYVSPCDVNSTLNCTDLYLSRFGTFHGVPVALGGVIWFALTALVAALARRSPQPGAAAGYLFLLTLAALPTIAYLAYASFVIEHKACLLCLGMDACVVGLFALMLPEARSVAAIKPHRDFDNGLRHPATLTATLAYVSAAVLLVTYFPREGTIAADAATTARAIAAAPGSDARRAFEAAWNAQPRVNLGIAPDGANVVIVKFNDYECPGCKEADAAYLPVVDAFAAANPGAVKYVLKDWPWNVDCNFRTPATFEGHDASCAAAAAARLAADRGQYDAMKAWLFANQGTTPAAVAAEATRLLGVTDFDRAAVRKLADVQRDVADGAALDITWTPTFFINGVRLPHEGVTPAYFSMAIDIELHRTR